MAIHPLFALSAGMALIAAAPAGEIEYPLGSLGYDALMAADYAAAEAQLRSRHGLAAYDPARLINLGQVLARTGREREASKLFKRVLEEDDVVIILADGRQMGSQTAARIALESLQRRRAPQLAGR